ncbi:hypothetical protein NIES592_00340 [Fischerella major NIES-592]|uniref:Uncharacterized protein n=2 Tax=Fischerella TaxID=1190 RepID=A0A1U7H4H8_9CYAN|nr:MULTISPECIES: hypothetical protein [Fischerella]OKH16167.1 hypothetical protein NIES592_00340 [Fischerella major NIES-592]PMB42797.1 hypothetical protein CEN41_14475 [Fischerella thermalis CCMEE 5330]BAU08534.1 hypothetical protein FIS3754_44820 [Fischerella sp. NIES-3754]BCX10912.1 MAG: hypothetical protein KatS3mg066_4771 [Fischerella sp.]
MFKFYVTDLSSVTTSSVMTDAVVFGPFYCSDRPSRNSRAVDKTKQINIPTAFECRLITTTQLLKIISLASRSKLYGGQGNEIRA